MDEQLFVCEWVSQYSGLQMRTENLISASDVETMRKGWRAIGYDGNYTFRPATAEEIAAGRALPKKEVTA